MSHIPEKKEAAVKIENKKAVGSIKIDSFYKAIVETIREPLLILDSDLRIIHANKSFYKVFKVNQNETIGNLIYDLGNRQWDIPELHSLLEEILIKKHQFINFQIESNFPVVGERIMQLNARRVINQKKNQQLILLAIEDVTERILVERSLLNSEEKFRRAFETARDGVLLINKISGKIVNSNQSAQNLLNYSGDELLELKLWEIGFLRDEKQFSDVNLTLEEKGLFNFNDALVRTKDKTEITADVYLMNKAKVIQCNIRNITDRKLLIDELIEKEGRYHDLFNYISSGVAVYEAVEDGKDFIIKDYNPAAEKIDHKSRSEVIGRKVTDVFPGIHEITLLETFRRVWKTGQPEHHPVSFYKDKNLTGWRENFVYRLPSGEIVVVYNDLTDMKKVEARAMWLASFPELNPLMVLEIDKNNHIEYMNPAVKKQFPDIEANSKSHPFFNNISPAIKSLQKENIENTTTEVKVGINWFSQIICSIKSSPNLRIYAYDITTRKQAELARQVLFEIVQGAIATEDLTEFFIQLHASISKIVYAENFYIFLYDNKKAIFNIAFSTDTVGSPFQILQMEKCLATTTFGTQQSSIFTQEQLKKLQKKNGKDHNEKRPLSGLCVPLKISDDTIGVVSLLDYEKEDRFQDSDKELFNLITGQIAQVILQKQTQNDLIKRNRMLRMLSETNRQLIHAENEKELLEAVCKIIVEDGGYRMAWIGYAEQDPEKSVTPVAQKGFETGYLDTAHITWADTKHGRGPTGIAIRTNTISLARNVQDDPNYLPWRDAAIKRGYKSSIAFPLTISEKPIGALNIYSNRFDAFDEEEISLLTELAGDLAYGIASLRMSEEKILAEGKLWESEEKFKFVFKNSVEGKAITFPSGEMQVNKAFYELLGYSEDEIQNKSWQDVTHPGDIELTQKEMNSLLTGKNTSIRFSKRYIKKDGSFIWADTLTSLRRDEKQNPVYFITAVIDISERVIMEQKLKESMEFQQSVFETTSLATIIIDKDMTVLLANKEIERLSGFTKEEIEGKKKWIDFVAPEYLEMMMDYHDQRRTDRERTPMQYEFKFITRKGDLRDIFLNVDMIPGTQKSVASLFDITERKRSEKALLEANNIINRSPAVAFLWKNKPGWPVEFVSENVKELFGYSAQEFMEGRIQFTATIYSSDLERVVEEVSRYSKIEGLHSFSHEPYRILTKNNELKWVDDLTYIRRDDKGFITHYEGIVFDISKRKAIEEELQISENKYRSVVEHAPLLINNFLPDGTITFVNKAYCDFFGTKYEDVIGSSIQFSISQQDREKVFAALKACTKESPVVVIENRVNVHGEMRWMRWTDCAFFDNNGKVINYQSYGQDIHERKHVEQLLQALNRAAIAMGSVLTKDEIFNVIAEELRNLDTSCMFFPIDKTGKKLLTKYLFYDSKFLKKAEKLIRIQHEDFSFPINAVKVYKEAIQQERVIYVDDTEQLYYQILPRSTSGFSKLIIESLHASKSIVAPLIVEGVVIGLFSVQSDYLRAEDVPIFTVFSDQLTGAWKKVELLQDLKKTIDGTILTIAATVEMRDPYTAGHQTRVAELATAIAVEMHLSAEQIESIHMAGIIHDLGKINVPAEILSKPGKISDLEFEIIKTHPKVGYDLLKRIEFPWPIAQIVYQHHEKMDGSGYPQGLKGEEIMIEARILCVADIVEAMSSHRPYRPSLGIDKALAQIKNDRGKLLDPHVVDACLKLFTHGYQMLVDENKSY